MRVHVARDWTDYGEQRLLCGFKGIPGMEYSTIYMFDNPKLKRFAKRITCKRCRRALRLP